MANKRPDSRKPLTEGTVKNNQIKSDPKIEKKAILKPPAAKPKKK
ncbi:hypothetical protein [Myroides odoratus]|nr:hypothetical protein [Myroides odoratus]